MNKTIALHDSDKTGYPNLALMKLSAYHKQKGDVVLWYSQFEKADIIYSSKVFTFTGADPYLPDSAIKGGTGYMGSDEHLTRDPEHIMPDYDLYPGMDYSMGFLTRGCIRNCDHCFVPEKEGPIRANADIEEFAQHKKVVLMDNNVLAHDHGISQIEKMSRMSLRVDFNQGLDARLIDDAIARRLGSLQWLSPLRLACDSPLQIEAVRKAVEHLRWNNVAPRRYFCYVLVKDVESALEVVRFLKSMNLDPFAQPYRDLKGTPPTREQECFARWVNMKSEFKSRTWEEYRKRWLNI